MDTADTEPELASCLASALHRSHWRPVHSAGHRSEVHSSPHQGSTVPHTPDQAGGREQLISKVKLRFGLYFHFFLVFFLYAKLKFLVRIVFGNADQPSLNISKMTKKEPVGQDSGRPKRSPSAKLLLLHQPPTWLQHFGMQQIRPPIRRKITEMVQDVTVTSLKKVFCR